MAFISKTKPSQSTRKVDQQKPALEIIVETDQVFNDALHTLDRFDRGGVDDGRYMTVLGKYQIERVTYEAIESSFDAMYENLMEDVEYFPEELVGGNPLDGYHNGRDGRMKTLLSLKHMATLPDARISELQWDTFVLA